MRCMNGVHGRRRSHLAQHLDLVPERHSHNLLVDRLARGRHRRRTRWTANASRLQRRQLQRAIVVDVTLRNTVLLVTHPRTRWRRHRSRWADDAPKTRQALTTRLHHCWRVWMRRLSRESEREWCARPYLHAWRSNGIPLRHGTRDWSAVVTVVLATLHVRTERAHIIAFLTVDVVDGRHVAVVERSANATYSG